MRTGEAVSGLVRRDEVDDATRRRPADSAPLVVLTGLPPDLGRALQAGLDADGLESRIQPDTAPVTRPPVPAGPVVSVLPLTRPPVPLPARGRALPGPVVVVVPEPTVAGYLEGLGTGAAGVISAATTVEDAVAAIRGATRGQVVLPLAVVRALQTAAPLLALSDVERAWLRELAMGARVGDLARAAGLPDREVYRALAELYAPLGVGNRAEALLLADRAGLLDPPT